MMRLLLDTHIALWAVTDPQKLDDGIREQIIDGENFVFVSAASLWEVAIKYSLQRPDFRILPEVALEAFREAEIDVLPVSAADVMYVGRMPFMTDDEGRLHNDPFDRLLMSQAAATGMTLVTHDAKIARYRQWVRDVSSAEILFT
jgi:PIN domain nuclease of toxin-antitoxin system